MEKIKKDTDTVTSNKKIAVIIISWTIIYGLILLAELFLDSPKVTDPFVNGLFILLGLAVGLYFFIKTKFEYMLEKIDINLILKGIFFLLTAIVVFSVSSFLNKLIDVTWQQNIIKVISTMLVALIGKSISKKVNKPLKEFEGELIAIINRKDDVETKWVVSSVGEHYSAEEIMEEVHFIEQYFDSAVELIN